MSKKMFVTTVFMLSMVFLGGAWAMYIYPTYGAQYTPVVPNGLGMEMQSSCLPVYEGIELLREEVEPTFNCFRSGVIYAYFDIEPLFEGENPELTYLRFFNKDENSYDSYYPAQIKSVLIRLNNATNIEKSSTEPLDDFIMHPNVLVDEISFVRVEIYGLVVMMTIQSHMWLWTGFIGVLLLMTVGTLLLGCTDWELWFVRRTRKRHENEETIRRAAGYLDIKADHDCYRRLDLVEIIRQLYNKCKDLTNMNKEMEKNLEETKEILYQRHQELDSRGDFCSYCGANLEGEEDTAKKGTSKDDLIDMVKDKWNEKRCGLGLFRSFKAVTVRMMCNGKCGELRKFFGFYEPSLDKYYLVCTECKHREMVEGDDL